MRTNLIIVFSIGQEGDRQKKGRGREEGKEES